MFYQFIVEIFFSPENAVLLFIFLEFVTAERTQTSVQFTAVCKTVGCLGKRRQYFSVL